MEHPLKISAEFANHVSVCVLFDTDLRSAAAVELSFAALSAQFFKLQTPENFLIDSRGEQVLAAHVLGLKPCHRTSFHFGPGPDASGAMLFHDMAMGMVLLQSGLHLDTPPILRPEQMADAQSPALEFGRFLQGVVQCRFFLVAFWRP